MFTFHVSLYLHPFYNPSVMCEQERECTGGMCGEGRYCGCLSSTSLSPVVLRLRWQLKAKEKSKLLDFCCEVEENCPLLSYYMARSGYFLTMFRGNLSVPSSMIKILGSLEMGLIVYPKSLVRNCLYLLR